MRRSPLEAALVSVPYKGVPKGAVEDRVDDGVDGGGDVAQPQADVHNVVRNVAAGTGGEQNVEHEEGRPAGDEGEEHQAQHFGRLLFRGHGMGRQ